MSTRHGSKGGNGAVEVRIIYYCCIEAYRSFSTVIDDVM
jgi:hypothetical protein